MQFASLGSGSKGNGSLIRNRDTNILVDCGFNYEITKDRLGKLGLNPWDLNAILVTHEHIDHTQGLKVLALKHGLCVYATRGTLMELDKHSIENVCEISDKFLIGSICINPIVVPHDARQPVQFVFESEGVRFGLLSDLGSLSSNVLEAYQNLDGLSVEFNHDLEMLNTGPYPGFLKRRVGGDFGHLSNDQAKELVQRVISRRLKHVIACHISETNNKISLVDKSIEEALKGTSCNRLISFQSKIIDWVALGEL